MTVGCVIGSQMSDMDFPLTFDLNTSTMNCFYAGVAAMDKERTNYVLSRFR